MFKIYNKLLHQKSSSDFALKDGLYLTGLLLLLRTQ